MVLRRLHLGPARLMLAAALLLGGMMASAAEAQPAASGVAIGVPASAPATPKPDGPKAEAAKTETAKSAASAASSEVPQEVYDRVFRILFSLLVIAVVLESALAVIFNWRLFLMNFDGRGVRTLVSVVVGWLVAAGLHIDVVGRLNFATNEGASAGDHPLGPVGYFITALVLAGGSAGVNNILKGLGFRDLLRHEDVAPRPPPTKAWVSVRLIRRNAKGPVTVSLLTGAAAVAGSINGERSPPRWLRPFVVDPARFPRVGGQAIEPGPDHTLVLEGVDAGGNIVSTRWGPRAFAAGAIVDLTMTL